MTKIVKRAGVLCACILMLPISVAIGQTAHQSAGDRALDNRDGAATRHEEDVLKRDEKSGHGSVRADEKAISRDKAVERRDLHNEAVERRNDRNAARYKEQHEKK